MLCIVDICGIVVDFNPIQEVVTTKENELIKKRDMIVADDTGCSIEVTLWGDIAEKLDCDFTG